MVGLAAAPSGLMLLFLLPLSLGAGAASASSPPLGAPPSAAAGGRLVEAIEALETLALDGPASRPTDLRRRGLGRAHASAPLMSPLRLLRGNPGNAARVPHEICQALSGREVHSFAHFRRLLWQAIAASRYADEFDLLDQALMRHGQAPLVPEGQHVARRRTYELHHIRPLARGGALYDFSNLMIVTPLYHASVLSPRYHFGRAPAARAAGPLS